MGRADSLPAIIQGGMGVAVSHWRLAGTVAQSGGLGVISGVGPDLVVSRVLQDGDPGGHVRRVMGRYPDQDFIDATLKRFYRPDGLEPGQPYRPIPKLDLNQRLDAVRLSVLGVYVQVALAKEGHDGPVGVNLLEKVQIWTPAALLGAMLADVDAALVGAGVPAHVPRLLDRLSRLEPVSLPIDVAGATSQDDYHITLDPKEVVPGLSEPLHRPAFLAIVSAHVLASYLARSEDTRPDGFVIEGPTAGGRTLDDEAVRSRVLAAGEVGRQHVRGDNGEERGSVQRLGQPGHDLFRVQRDVVVVLGRRPGHVDRKRDGL